MDTVLHRSAVVSVPPCLENETTPNNIKVSSGHKIKQLFFEKSKLLKKTKTFVLFYF